jgi:hypothetical protein
MIISRVLVFIINKNTSKELFEVWIALNHGYIFWIAFGIEKLIGRPREGGEGKGRTVSSNQDWKTLYSYTRIYQYGDVLWQMAKVQIIQGRGVVVGYSVKSRGGL